MADGGEDVGSEDKPAAVCGRSGGGGGGGVVSVAGRGDEVGRSSYFVRAGGGRGGGECGNKEKSRCCE